MKAQPPDEVARRDALVGLGRWLQSRAYRFVTVTPATQARVNARPGAGEARSLRDVFGWSRPFAPDLLEQEALQLLRDGELLDIAEGGLLRSKVRFSSFGELLFSHSAYPTLEADAMFFGPDSWRFAALVESEVANRPLPPRARILGVGCGAGAGGIVAALRAAASEPKLILVDTNPRSLQYASANAALAGVARVEFEEGELFEPVRGDFDLIVANQPYLNDGASRSSTPGGGLAERTVREGLPRLASGGRVVLYTGSAITDGVDPLHDALAPHLDARAWPWRYREIDPDVFGEELEQPAYANVERIAAVAVVVQRPEAVPARPRSRPS
jgi:SAM-dependent methyltransferase